MKVYVIDLGGQYTHVIWRTVRDLGQEVEIKPKNIEFKDVKDGNAIIFSGGPGSAPSEDFGVCEEIIKEIKTNELEVPLLGICMGHQLIAHRFGGKVEKGEHAEYGTMKITVDEENDLFKGIPKEFNVWVSHFDEIKELSENFIVLAHSKVCAFEAIKHKEKNIYGVQFHPEVWHTENGEKILENFLNMAKDK